MSALLKYWREALAALLLGFAVRQCQLRDHAIADKAVADLLVAKADDTVKVYADSLRRSGTGIVRDTVRVEHFLASTRVDTLWRRDTIRLGADSVPRLAVPLPVVAGYDSLGKACQELAGDCALFRRSATATMDAQRQEIAALKARPDRSCALPSIITGALGAGAGFYLRGRLP